MRSFHSSLLTLGALALVACDKGTTTDPTTVNRSELNPPSGLITVTDKAGVELRWDAANAEDELAGYDVFVIKADIKDLSPPSYPTNLAKTLAKGSFPRCKDNSDFFKKFGFDATDRSCEGDAEATSATTTAAKTVGGSYLAEGSGSTTTVTEKLANYIPCTGTAESAGLSLAASGTVLTQQSCIVTQYWDPTTKSRQTMKAGENYVFFVATVAGTDKNQLSWTSSFVEDALNARLMDAELTIEATKSYNLPLAKLTAFTGTITNAATDWVPASCVPTVCTINKLNDQAEGLWLGRLGDGSFKQRVFFSAPAGKSIEVQLRGPQTKDPNATAGTVSYTIPGDEATTVYDKLGTLNPVYGNQVFDLKVTTTAGVNYGKIVFYPVTDNLTDAGAAFKQRVVIIMQPLVGSFHYFQEQSF